MAYLYTGSTNQSSISTGLSTQVIVQVNNQTVGALQGFNPRQSRAIRGVAEVGTDGFVEKVPHQPTNVTVEVERVMFDRLRLPSAFARQFVNIHAQRVPFDIVLFDKTNAQAPLEDGDVDLDNDAGVITHVYKNCWFSNYASRYQANDYIITENATIECEFVSSFTGDDQSLAGTDARGIQFDTAGGNIEQIADRGRRGSLDAAGLAALLALTP